MDLGLAGRVAVATGSWHITSPSERKELSLPTITIPRGDLTSEEVTTALRASLGPHSTWFPGCACPRPVSSRHSPTGDPDTILVSIGSSRPPTGSSAPR